MLDKPPTDNQADVQATLVDLQAQIFRQFGSTSRPIPQLMTWLVDRRNLIAAYDRVAAAGGANTPGPDGLTCRELTTRISRYMATLVEELLHDRFTPSAPRWVEVPKPSQPDKTRRIGILNVRDRIVHAALKQVLEPLLEPLFYPFSYGFRPGRSVAAALAEAIRLLTGDRNGSFPYPVALHLDIANCFDNIDHALLMQAVARQVSDAKVLQLIQGILTVSESCFGRFWWRHYRGLVQGSALSPLLCNLYLHQLDQSLSQLMDDTRHAVRFLRYADDLLLLAADDRSAKQSLRHVQACLADLRMRLRESSARPCDTAGGIAWLGVRLRMRPQRWLGRATFGYVVPDEKVIEMLGAISEMTEPPSDRLSSGAFDLAGWINCLNEQLSQWRQAYVFADNATELFRALDDHTRYRLGGLIAAVTGKPLRQVYSEYRQWLPRGFWTWQVDGTRLKVLSALAPQAPTGLVRRPAWMRKI